MCMHIQTYTHTYIHTYMHVHTYTYTHIHVKTLPEITPNENILIQGFHGCARGGRSLCEAGWTLQGHLAPLPSGAHSPVAQKVFVSLPSPLPPLGGWPCMEPLLAQPGSFLGPVCNLPHHWRTHTSHVSLAGRVADIMNQLCAAQPSAAREPSPPCVPSVWAH